MKWNDLSVTAQNFIKLFIMAFCIYLAIEWHDSMSIFPALGALGMYVWIMISLLQD